jgi:predicted porin
MGIHDTPFKMTGRKFDPFDDTIADNAQLLGNGNTGIGGFDQRPNNVLAYITPNFNGFNAVVAYVTGLANSTYTDIDGNAGVGGADNNKATAFSLSGSYANGPIDLGAAYESHNVKDFAGGQNDPSAFRLGGSFNFGPGKVGAMWEQLNDITGADVSRDGWTLFGTYTFGLETVKLAYTQVGKLDFAGTEAPNSDASLVALALDHKFSKRTTGYVQYTALSNENAAQYALGGNGSGYGDPVTPGVGKDPSAFSVGLIHNF